MLLYTTIGTNDLARAVAFWGPIMEALGHPAVPDLGVGWAGWGQDYDNGFGFYLCSPFDGAKASAGNGLTVAFPARDAVQVRALYDLALQNGGSDDGPPGTRDYYSPDFYVAYVRDPDGHKLAFVFHHYDHAQDWVTPEATHPAADHYPPKL
ncbi:MAG: VOC family protein, partial [Paracoccaceae bacterium]